MCPDCTFRGVRFSISLQMNGLHRAMKSLDQINIQHNILNTILVLTWEIFTSGNIYGNVTKLGLWV